MSFDFGSLEKKPNTVKTTKPTASGKSQTQKPTFNFGTSETTKSTTSAKTPHKTTSKSVHGASRKGKRSRSPFDTLKDINPMALYGGIGGVVLLIIVIAYCCLAGNGNTAKLTSNDKWKAHINAAYKLTNKGEYQKAIAEYEKAYKLNPQDNYAPDQISIIYRNNLHDEAQAEHWKSISYRNQAGNLEEMEGASARVYAERAAKKKAKQGKR